ncbi:S1C family serine protease [Nonomuraea endophytica]|uniref:Putative serine protease PepD n=1 Tax=Nonomuraea endophytica TaxID=714136 RepID=A0A7W8ELT3_9ACTN|nr:trypsin-like peptidase domain-containing protein [Nonomuraea endophytica]MBB5084234.1 putative serine protease PepD [Nonomuraea endophytica]
MTGAHRGLGTPRGPDFVSPLLGHMAPQAEGAGAVPAGRAPRRGALLLSAVLVAGLTGAVAGFAGAGLATGPAPVTLPRAAPAAPNTTGLSGTAARLLPSVVSIDVGRGGGSGFIVDGAGHIITNAHVVGEASTVSVVLNDGRRFSARVLGADQDEDLAVLEVAGVTGLAPATLGRSADLAVGDQVLAIGSPLGLSGTVTSGIVSALDRQVRLGGTSRSAVQTDASINPGNSGGPLVNARGEVVGVNTAIASSRGGGNIGIGFAIPIDRAAPIAEQIIRD